MASTLIDSSAARVLDRLFADAEQQKARRRERPKPQDAPQRELTPFERFSALKDAYLPIDRTFGTFMYSLIRATGARTVVEFGASLGISTLFLAAAVRDNGAGKVVTTEFIAEKAERARENWTEAGLIDVIELRVGDAIHTLDQPLPGPVDFLFLDAEKSMYLDILKLLEPHIKPGCLIAADNTNSKGAAPYVAYIRDPGNGYISSAVSTSVGDQHHTGREITVRL